MVRSRLKVYYGPQTETLSQRFAAQPERVKVTVADVLPLLADALRSERTWLGDFADDEMEISSDLYEVLLAYQHLRRPGA